MRRIWIAATAALLCGAGPPPTLVIDPSPEAREPQATIDGKGRISVTYGRAREIVLATSVDGGKSFSSHTLHPSTVTHLGMRRGPRVAATDAAVVVTAIGKDPEGDVLAWRSTDRGKSWDGPVKLNSPSNSAREGLHAMASGPDGAMFCAWLDLRDNRMEIYGARSTDGGATWRPDHRVYRAPEKNVCNCCHPSVAYAPDGTLYVMFRNDVKGSRDMYLTHSNDGGETFSPAEKLGRKTWKIAACPMDGGSIAVGPNGRVETAWMRAAGVFLAKPAEAERPVGDGVQPWCASGAEGPITVWLSRKSGTLRASLGPDADCISLADSANDPVVVSGGGMVLAAWEQPGEGIRARLLTSEGK